MNLTHKNNNIKKREIFFLILGSIAVLIYCMPWIYYGPSSYIRIHDGLDSLLVYFKLLAEGNFLFSPNSAYVGEIFKNGMPRISYPNEISIVTALFYLFDPYWAYVLNQVIIRLIAFFGMFLLLLSILNDATKLRIFITFAVAVLYSYLPFWPWSASVPGLPFMFLILHKAWKGSIGKLEVIISIIYPFYSSLFLAGLYVVGIFWVAIPIFYILKRSIRPILLIATTTTFFHILVDYRYVEFLFNPGFISHRVDYKIPLLNFTDALVESIRVFRYGEWAETSHNPVIFFVSIFILFFLFVLFLADKSNKIFNKKIFPGNFSLNFYDNFIILLFLIASCTVISILSGFSNWDGISQLKRIYPVLNAINLTRFSFLLPCFWFVTFGYVLVILAENLKYFSRILVMLLLSSQLDLELQKHEFFISKAKYGITYQHFYSESLFREIDKKLSGDKSSYVTASLGLHPSILQFNGFRTADGYIANYPKDYKIMFRKVIVNEFSKKPELLSYFEDWGNRAYFFSAEMRCPRDDNICLKGRTPSIPTPHFDFQAMKDLGVEYIFSAAELTDPLDHGLLFIGTFENPESPWRISIYKLTLNY